MPGVVCACLLAPGAAQACTPRPEGMQTVASAQTVVHFAAPATATDASDLLRIVDAARLHHREALRMPDPEPDADGRFDVYIGTFSFGPGVEGAAAADCTGTEGTAPTWLAIAPGYVRDRAVIAHELMHAVQNAIFTADPPALREATAEWAAARFTGANRRANHLRGGRWRLDCAAPCAYGNWPFYEHLSERFGIGVVRALHEQAAHGGSFHGVLDVVLTSRGSSLNAELAEFARRTLDGSFAFAPLAGLRAEPAQTLTVRTGAPAKAAPVLDPLSVAVIELLAGHDSRCAGSHLLLDGAGSAFLHPDGRARPLVAPALVPIDGCEGASAVALVNGSPSPQRVALTATIAPGPQRLAIKRLQVRGRRARLSILAPGPGIATATLASARRSVAVREGAATIALPLRRPLRSAALTVTWRALTGGRPQRITRRVRLSPPGM